MCLGQSCCWVLEGRPCRLPPGELLWTPSSCSPGRSPGRGRLQLIPSVSSLISFRKGSEDLFSFSLRNNPYLRNSWSSSQRPSSRRFPCAPTRTRAYQRLLLLFPRRVQEQSLPRRAQVPTSCSHGKVAGSPCSLRH